MWTTNNSGGFIARQIVNVFLREYTIHYTGWSEIVQVQAEMKLLPIWLK